MTIDYNHARELMVEQQIRPWDVLELRVLKVLATLPREAFVADACKALAYSDVELPLANGQKMMKPVIEGRTLQALNIQDGESVLEIIPAISTGELRYALDRQGLRLDGTLLRRRAAGEAPLAPVVPSGGEDQIEESDGPAPGAPRSILPGNKG